jgi:probable F420-dependent oxidoreductase
VRFTVEYPVSVPAYDPALLSPEGLTRVVQAADRLGFEAVAFTEHPAPSLKWLAAGGHESLDVAAALAFCAAVTRRIRLMTYLLVLPYRNPFLNAKAVATVDLLSGGRTRVVAGAGYLKSEYRALGVDFEQRNALFDEAVEVMRGVWTSVPFDHEGLHFTAQGVAAKPLPVQPGGPPIWIGGNSAMARRSASRAQGWSPLMISEELARTTRMPPMSTVEQLAASVELEQAGAGWFVVRPPGSSVEAAVEGLERYAALLGLPGSSIAVTRTTP